VIVVSTRLTSHDVSQEPVRARVLVGPTQRAIWSLALGLDPVAKGTGSEWIELGKGTELRGNRLEVSAVVMDVDDASEEVVCAVEVEGPALTRLEIRHAMGHGDSAALAVTVLFQ
jgi:hypothetical protein